MDTMVRTLLCGYGLYLLYAKQPADEDTPYPGCHGTRCHGLQVDELGTDKMQRLPQYLTSTST